MEITITMSQSGPTTTQATIRKHQLIIDRPESKGGSDLGPMGGEVLLAALGGCFSSNLLAAINTRNLDIREVNLKITGTIDGQPLAYTKILVEVSASGDTEELEKLVTMADRACISSNTLRSSQVEVVFQVV